jgi:hypothetical protein
VTVTLPTTGNLAATATWQFGLNAGEGGDCAVTLDSTAYSSQFGNAAYIFGGMSYYEFPASATALFANVASGQHTIRLICKADFGSLITIARRSLTVLFVPGSL